VGSIAETYEKRTPKYISEHQEIVAVHGSLGSIKTFMSLPARNSLRMWVRDASLAVEIHPSRGYTPDATASITAGNSPQ
jgi:hypothetical protein